MIDVIMPTYLVDGGSIHLTKMAVKSLKKSPVRIIIVDDESKIGGSVLKELADVYIRNKKNKGFAGSVNVGLKEVETDLVAIANNDIRVDTNWYSATQDIMKNKKVGSLHFRMIPYDQPFNPGTKTWITGKERWTHFSFLVARMGIQKMDSKFYNTYGDWDFVYRLRKKGYYTAYTNKAEFQHLDTYTVNAMPEMTLKNEKNRAYFKAKHGEYADIILARQFPEQMLEKWKPFA